MKVTQSAIQTGSLSYRERLSSEIGELFRAFERKLILLLPFYQMEMVVIRKGHGLKYKQDELGITDGSGISSLFFLNFLI